MSKIRIVLLTDCLIDAAAGGAERKIYELAQHLSKDNFEVTIASLDCEGTTQSAEVEAIGCRLKVLRVKRIYGISGLREGINFYRFLKENKIDIVQTCHFSSDTWGTVIARLAGVKVIVSNRRDMGFWRGSHHVAAYRFVNRWVTKIVVVSKAVKDVVIKEEGVAAHKIEVIYNGVKLSAVNNPKSETGPLRQELGAANHELIIVHVGQLSPVKGHVYLFEAMSRILKKVSHVKLVLIGEGPDEASLRDLVKELGLSGAVSFLGKRFDVRRLLTAADICVLPSLSEGMSNAILEYMDAGKPVVATSVGGNPETLENGVSGILIEPKNAQQLAEALEKLLQDEDLRAAMGQRARRRVEEVFDIRQMFETYERFFAETLR